jgi:hypothetical protein
MKLDEVSDNRLSGKGLSPYRDGNYTFGFDVHTAMAIEDYSSGMPKK